MCSHCTEYGVQDGEIKQQPTVLGIPALVPMGHGRVSEAGEISLTTRYSLIYLWSKASNLTIYISLEFVWCSQHWLMNYCK